MMHTLHKNSNCHKVLTNGKCQKWWFDKISTFFNLTLKLDFCSQTGRVRKTRDGDLLMSTVHYSDGGVYSCTPYNALGTTGASTQVRLIVKEPPRFLLRPRQEIELEIGRTLHAACSGEGDPSPSVFWRKVSD